MLTAVSLSLSVFITLLPFVVCSEIVFDTTVTSPSLPLSVFMTIGMVLVVSSVCVTSSGNVLPCLRLVLSLLVSFDLLIGIASSVGVSPSLSKIISTLIRSPVLSLSVSV